MLHGPGGKSHRRLGWRTWLTLALVAAAFVAGYRWGHPTATAPETNSAVHDHGQAEETVWTCSMHPQIRQSKPGKCPICGMDLIPAGTGSGDNDNPRVFKSSPAAAALMDVETAPVERRFASVDVRMVGKIDYDETRLATISAWVPGRLDRLYVDYTGIAVRKGDHMVSLYSPELLSTQGELRRAAQAVASVKPDAPEVLRQAAQTTLEAARSKLRRWGLTDEQVRQAEQASSPSDRITIYAPIGGTVIERNGQEGEYVEKGMPIYKIADLGAVWVKLQAYESDLAWLHYGQMVSFEAEAFPGERFEARIAFIDPVLDPMTRAVNIRLNVVNKDQRLKPGMFVRAIAHAEVASDGRVMDPGLAGKWISPMHPEIIKDGPGNCDVCGMPLVRAEDLGYIPQASADAAKPLVIPVSAALVTGKRAVVYVALPDNANGPAFEGREVKLGPRAGDYYIVVEGLQEGERVVTRGNFKIDSAQQLLARPSMMNPVEKTAAAAPAERAAASAPAEFQSQLRGVGLATAALADALASDDAMKAKGAVSQVARALDGVDMMLLSGAAHEQWMTDLNALRGGLDTLTATEEIGALRTGLDALMKALLPTLKSFGIGAGPPLYRAHCPMAFDGKGADWLQTTEDIRNPYYGESMLTCGSVEETFGAPEAKP